MTSLKDLTLKNPIVINDIIRDPYYHDDYMFEKGTLTLTQKVNIFVGPNGYGKTTLLRMMKQALEKQGAFSFSNNAYSRSVSKAFRNVLSSDSTVDNEDKATLGFISYDSHADDHTNTMSSTLANKDLVQFALRGESSEGQNNLYSMMDLFNNAQAIAKKHQNLEQLIIFVDGIDSGLSVDMIDLIIRTLDVKMKQVEDENPNLEVAMIFTTNNYEMVRDSIALDPITSEPIEYESYEDFRKDMKQKSRL
jgi:hypothetical protein